MTRSVIEFPPFRLDLADERLWCGERSIPLRPKTFAVLRRLVEQPDRLVTKEALLSAVWPGTAVTDDTLTKSIRELRRALGDDARVPRFIETVARRGFRWIAPLAPCAAPPGAVVGRDAELRRLEDWFAAARRGQREIVFVTGDAGIGKTTLVETLLARLEAPRPPLIGRGQCIEHHGPSEPYMPLLDAFAQLAAGPGRERVAAALRRHGPTWLAQLPSLADGVPLAELARAASGSTRQRMLRECAATLAALSSATPVILALEDLHWSDHATVDVLALLARRTERAQLLVLGTVRPVDLVVHDHPLAGVKAELVRQRHARELRLELLVHEDVAAYLAARFAPNDFPPSLATHLLARTEGNPFFMVAALDHLMRDEALVWAGGRWTLRGAVEPMVATVPDDVAEMIERQHRALGGDEQEILSVASVAGIEFAAPVVAAATGRAIDVVEERCSALARRDQFLRAAESTRWPDGTPATGFRFLHSLHRTVLYDRVPATRRMRWHLAVAERLERGFAGKSAIAAELASHFEQAGETARALPWLEKAARRAQRRAAPLEAARILQHAIALGEALPGGKEHDERLMMLTLEHANALQLALGYGHPKVEQGFTRGRRRSEELGAPAAQFLALSGLAAFHLVRGDLAAARDETKAMLELAERLSFPGGKLIAHTFGGMTRYLEGALRTAREIFAEALALTAEQPPGLETDFPVLCLSHLACTQAILGFPDQAQATARNARARATTTGRYDEATAAFCSSALAAMLHDAPGAESASADAISIAETYGFPMWLPPARVVHGWAVAVGRDEPAGLEEMRAGLAGLDDVDFERDRTFHSMLLADALATLGDRDAARTAVAEGLTRVERSGVRCCEAELWRLQGDLAEDGDAAEAALHRAIAVARAQEARWWELRAAARLVQRTGGRRDGAESRAALRDLLGWFTEGVEMPDLVAARAAL